MQTQSRAALNGQRNISKIKSHQFYSPEYKANVSRTEINEQYLISRLAQGDESAFWSLWEQYCSYLHICCLRWLGTRRHEVDDALSRASIKALNGLLNNGHNITHLKGWLSRLTHNICIDIIRERNRHRKSLYRIGELAEIGEWPFGYSPPSAEDTLLQSEMSTAVRRAVSVLPCRLQIPSMMRFFQEMPYQDIARQLKITPANARKRIQQARAIIQDQLDPYVKGIGDPLIKMDAGVNQDENTCELPSEHSDVEDLESDTIKPCIAPYRLIRVKLRSGMEMEYYFPLKSVPKRIHQKIRTLKKYVQNHPRSWRKLLKLADFQFVTGDWPDAVDNYRRVLEMQPSFFQVWLQLGNILHLIGEEDVAVVAFERARELSRNRASRHYILGLIEICCGNCTKANVHFQKATALESDNSAHWHGLGATSLPRCKFGEAIRAYEHSLKTNPDDTVALINSYDALMASEKENEALTHLEKALAISPDDMLGLLRLAQFRIKSGLVFKAQGTRTKQILRQLLSLAPKSIDSLAALAYFYSTRGDVDRGNSVFQKIIENHGTNPYAKYTYALWRSNPYDCQFKMDDVCSFGAFPRSDNNLYVPTLDHVLPFQNNENICTAVKDKLRCIPSHWSIYANVGISAKKTNFRPFLSTYRQKFTSFPDS